MLKSVRPQMVNGDALHAVLVRLHARTQASTHTHTCARSSVLLDTYVACLFVFYVHVSFSVTSIIFSLFGKWMLKEYLDLRKERKFNGDNIIICYFH
jgi:hypothetical protein